MAAPTTEGTQDASGAVVTIGTYDGVHLGHRQLIALAKHESATRDLPLVIVTFDRHPSSVVRPQQAPKLLTGIDHKLELLRATEADRVVVLHFDAARAAETAEDFVAAVLVEELHTAIVVVGENFRFGNGHRGDVALLQKLGGNYGFDTRGVALFTDNATRSVVSATRIRGLVAEASFEEASQLLGRPHEVRGIVAELSGAEEGSLGLVVDAELCLPPLGRYRGMIRAKGVAADEVTARLLASGDGDALVAIEGSSSTNGPLLQSGTHAALQFVAPADDDTQAPSYGNGR